MLGNGSEGRGERNMEFCIDQGEQLVEAARDIDKGEDVVVDCLQDSVFYEETFCDEVMQNIPLDISKNPLIVHSIFSHCILCHTW